MDPQLQRKRNSNPDPNIQNKNSEIENPKSKIKSRKKIKRPNPKSKATFLGQWVWANSLQRQPSFGINFKIQPHFESFGRAWTSEGQRVHNKMQTPILNHMLRDSL